MRRRETASVTERRGKEIMLISGCICYGYSKSGDLIPLVPAARLAGYRVCALADHLGISERWLSALFKAGVGIGVKTWMSELRFLDVCQILRETADGDRAMDLAGFAFRKDLEREIRRFSGVPLATLISILKKHSFQIPHTSLRP